jgi:aminocarboxymuconate-semialdehyde decarboxylase
LIREPRPTETVQKDAASLRHLVAVVGPGHIGLGTDYPFPWTNTPVDHLMATPGLSDADRTAILGGTMTKLLRIGT